VGNCLGLIVLLILLSVIGWVIDLIIPGRMPYGWLGGIVAAVIGGIIGGWLFGFLSFGPWADVGSTRFYFIPGLLGGIVLAFVVRFIMGSQGRRTL
jgi:uncharacterized membrane protein YeaQ/YmgE (transglycosylase-associated protein family)